MLVLSLVSSSVLLLYRLFCCFICVFKEHVTSLKSLVCCNCSSFLSYRLRRNTSDPAALTDLRPFCDPEVTTPAQNNWTHHHHHHHRASSSIHHDDGDKSWNQKLKDDREQAEEGAVRREQHQDKRMWFEHWIGAVDTTEKLKTDHLNLALKTKNFQLPKNQQCRRRQQRRLSFHELLLSDHRNTAFYQRPPRLSDEIWRVGTVSVTSCFYKFKDIMKTDSK